MRHHHLVIWMPLKLSCFLCPVLILYHCLSNTKLRRFLATSFRCAANGTCTLPMPLHKVLSEKRFFLICITICSERLVCLQFIGSLIVGAFLIRKWNEPFGYSRISPAYTQAWSTLLAELVCQLTVYDYVGNNPWCTHYEWCIPLFFKLWFPQSYSRTLFKGLASKLPCLFFSTESVVLNRDRWPDQYLGFPIYRPKRLILSGSVGVDKTLLYSSHMQTTCAWTKSTQSSCSNTSRCIFVNMQTRWMMEHLGLRSRNTSIIIYQIT